jgi:hypothetical protein
MSLMAVISTVTSSVRLSPGARRRHIPEYAAADAAARSARIAARRRSASPAKPVDRWFVAVVPITLIVAHVTVLLDRAAGFD